MRVQVKRQQTYGAAQSMTLALVTVYAAPDDNLINSYREQRARPGAYMKECTTATPHPDNPIQSRIRELCPQAQRIKLYIQEWGMTGPSHYVILHRTGTLPIYRLACDRLLSCLNDPTLLIDGVLITWPDANPEVGCGQTPIIHRILSSGASTLSTEVLQNPEIQRELKMAIDVAYLYGTPKECHVWTHPGKAVFSLAEDGSISLIRLKPYAKNVTKPNVIVWGDVGNNSLPDAPELPRHIMPQIKNAEPSTGDALLTRMLRFALEARLLPYIAVSSSTTRGDIYVLNYDPANEEAFTTCIATNHKVTGLPRVLRINNEGHDVFVPDLVLAAHLKKLFFDRSGGDDVYSAHLHALRGLLKTMGYSTWDHVRLAFKNWRVPLTPDEDEALEILRVE